MKKALFLYALTYSSIAFSQVGFNTPAPQATLDITAKNPTGNSVNVDGLLIPRVDRQKAQSMTQVKVSTIIYINNISTGTQSGTTANVDSTGFYYFDGNLWTQFNSTSSQRNIYNTNGTLSGNRTVAQRLNTIAFTGNSINAFSVDQNTFSVDASNHRIGIGTRSPQNRVHLGTDAPASVSDPEGKKLALYNNADKSSFYGLGISANKLQIHASSKNDEAPAMVITNNKNVGIGNTDPGSSTILDLSSTNRGFLMPRLSTAQRDAISPKVAGLAIYNSTINCMQYWDSTTWRGKCQTSIGSLNCSGTQYSGTLSVGQSAGFYAYIPYTGGNGGTYNTQTIYSTGITGLQLYIYSGTLANGNGNITGWITGTPQTLGIANFTITIGGKTCTLSLQVQEPPVPNNNSCAWTIPYRSVGSAASGTINQKTVTATVVSMTGGMGNFSDGNTYCSLPAAPKANAYGTYGNTAGASVRFKFNRKVANFMVKIANNQSGEYISYTLYKDGKVVTPTNTALSGCTNNYTLFSNTVTCNGGYASTIWHKLGGVWFDEIVISHNGRQAGANFEFCIGNTY